MFVYVRVTDVKKKTCEIFTESLPNPEIKTGWYLRHKVLFFSYNIRSEQFWISQFSWT
jgi:hypothetical protein